MVTHCIPQETLTLLISDFEANIIVVIIFIKFMITCHQNAIEAFYTIRASLPCDVAKIVQL